MIKNITPNKQKPPFMEWLLLDNTPFWLVTRVGFIGTIIILIFVDMCR